MYSSLQADVEDPSDPETAFNEQLMSRLRLSDRVLICGQALSHVVKYTVEDIVKSWNGNMSKLFLLEDGCSNVKGSEKIGWEFVEEIKRQKVNVIKCAEAFPKMDTTRNEYEQNLANLTSALPEQGRQPNSTSNKWEYDVNAEKLRNQISELQADKYDLNDRMENMRQETELAYGRLYAQIEELNKQQLIAQQEVEYVKQQNDILSTTLYESQNVLTALQAELSTKDDTIQQLKNIISGESQRLQEEINHDFQRSSKLKEQMEKFERQSKDKPIAPKPVEIGRAARGASGKIIGDDRQYEGKKKR